jgi:hypothetical protein
MDVLFHSLVSLMVDDEGELQAITKEVKRRSRPDPPASSDEQHSLSLPPPHHQPQPIELASTGPPPLTRNDDLEDRRTSLPLPAQQKQQQSPLTLAPQGPLKPNKNDDSEEDPRMNEDALDKEVNDEAGLENELNYDDMLDNEFNSIPTTAPSVPTFARISRPIFKRKFSVDDTDLPTLGKRKEVDVDNNEDNNDHKRSLVETGSEDGSFIRQVRKSDELGPEQTSMPNTTMMKKKKKKKKTRSNGLHEWSQAMMTFNRAMSTATSNKEEDL